MKPIRILIIDDQYKHDNVLKTDLLTRTGMTEAGTRSTPGNIEAVFCAGQKEQDGKLLNDYADIVQAVAQGYGGDAEFQWGLVLLDVRFDSQPMQPGDDTFGVSVREWLRRDFLDFPVVMFTGKHESEIINSQEHYLSKEGINAFRLKQTLLDYGKLEMDQARQLLGVGDEVVFASREMLNVYRDAYLSAKSDDPILILGESGSGKESLANYIHHMSSRSNGPFVAKNMAELPEGQEESILFGTNKGAFSQAINAKGLFEEADKGTLFLDEIGEMPESAQPKILRAVQQKILRRVGGRKDIAVDVRFISATNRHLNKQNGESKVRSDLVHRLNATTITVPPLRERRADIAPLAQFFLESTMKVNGSVGIRLSDGVMNKLRQYDFPGNVRELENMVKTLVSRTGNNRVIKPDEINLPATMSISEQHVTWEEVHPELSASATIADKSNANSLSVPKLVNLSNLHEVIAAIDIKPNDPALQGIKPRVECAVQDLMQRCAGAALERCKNPMTGEYILQTAMQLLSNDKTVKGARMYRELDKIFNRPQKTASVNQDDLKVLVKVWENSKKI